MTSYQALDERKFQLTELKSMKSAQLEELMISIGFNKVDIRK